ncbi:DJ-1/PfpI family protein [Kurthia zopfii]|uniref:DJ-1/PfpI family protein n=1 Tax=Kurthia zopfii TaxID=1650 RepID=UPI000F70F167|nr:DJ-1/PfpI family protein [Kurthia zopfii]VEI07533.1 General stress protein 18 [Kurthia zopfii]
MKKVLLLLADGFEMVEASVFTDVFGWNQFEGDGTTELTTVGIHQQLTATWNFTITPEKILSEINLSEFDALAIPGGFEEAGFYKDAFSKAFQEVVTYFHSSEKTIATICVASLILGKSGILQNVEATTYSHPTSIRVDQLKNFGANYVNERVVSTDHLITSSNPSTGFDVAFALLEKLTTTENMNHVKDLMGFK